MKWRGCGCLKGVGVAFLLLFISAGGGGRRPEGSGVVPVHSAVLPVVEGDLFYLCGGWGT